jgi:hypothetical protein
LVSSPKPPDPAKTAAAQSGLNLDTALTQQIMGMTGQVGPWGSTTYDEAGSTSFVNSQGRTVTIPRYTQTTTYNPEQQAIFDKTTQAQGNLADLAVQQSDAMQRHFATPFEFNNQDAANWAYDLAAQRILPQQQEAQKALETRLMNSGLRPGTAAWDSEMRRMTNANTDQMNQLALTSRGQAFNEANITRNQPINELTALMSGSQIAGPNTGFSPTPQPSVAGVDYTGLVSDNYQAQLQNSGGIMGGMFGLAGSLGGAAIKAGMFSDARLKTDISRIGELPNGLPLYLFRYRDGGPMQMMAQDVAQVQPDAVFADPGSGFLKVDYEQAVR